MKFLPTKVFHLLISRHFFKDQHIKSCVQYFIIKHALPTLQCKILNPKSQMKHCTEQKKRNKIFVTLSRKIQVLTQKSRHSKSLTELLIPLQFSVMPYYSNTAFLVTSDSWLLFTNFSVMLADCYICCCCRNPILVPYALDYSHNTCSILQEQVTRV